VELEKSEFFSLLFPIILSKNSALSSWFLKLVILSLSNFMAALRLVMQELSTDTPLHVESDVL